MARLVSAGAARRGVELDSEPAGRLGLMISALGNGLALEKLADPEAVPAELFGDPMTLIFEALAALAEREGASLSPGGRA
jgi:hypothetical protein